LRDRRTREVLVVAQQFDLVVRRTVLVVVVEVHGDHVDRLTQPLLGAPQPRGRALQRRRQVVVAELDRSEGHVVDLVLRVVGSGQLGRHTGIVELQLHRVLTHPPSLATAGTRDKRHAETALVDPDGR